jgi:hypothetical protein
MRRFTSILLLAIALLLSGFTLTSATADGDDKDNGNGDTIKVTAVSEQFRFVDVAPKREENVGDYFAFSDNVKKAGKNGGQLDGVCTVTRIDGDEVTIHCVATLTLSKGSLTVQGAVLDSENTDEFTIAVTGGTDRFSGAGGEAHVEFVSDTEMKITIELEN